MHPLLIDLEARERVATRLREAEARRLVATVSPSRPRLRVRAGAALVRLGVALQGRAGVAPRPCTAP